MEFNENLGSYLTIYDIQKLTERGTGEGILPFKWDKKYLPYIIGFFGITSALLVGIILKKHKRKRGKK